MAESDAKLDKELEEFRSAMEVPSTFEEGFNWSSLAGAVFIGLFMVPGALYMTLLAGQGIGAAAQWVTVILFIEVARRAQRRMKRPEIFVLFFMAAAMMAASGQGLLWAQFFARSDSAHAYGIAKHIPAWYAPGPDSPSYEQRTFFHLHWLPAIGMFMFTVLAGQFSKMVLGYGLFRLTSDIERLPFPMAPIGAQGIMALAEDVDDTESEDGEKSWRWRVFSIGGALGMAFGAVYLLLPALTGALTGKPVVIFPIPFSDFTQKTEMYLPAVATGMAWNMGHLITGMVLPFWAMVGSFVGLIVTFVANPILYLGPWRLLKSWQPGDGTVETIFKNNVDFYFSFTLGISAAIAVAGIYQATKSYLRAVKKGKARREVVGRHAEVFSVPQGRGDIKGWIVLVCYLGITTAYVLLSGYLIDWHPGVMLVLVFLGYVYTPLIGYVTARLEGIAGQVVEIPMIRQAAFILCGYEGVKIWFLPVPQAAMSQIGGMVVFYRQCELTGTRFRSIWKSTFVLYPLILVCTVLFSNFIWSLAKLPSAVYPYAQKMWELRAATSCIMQSSTLGGEYTIFEDAFKWPLVFAGTGFGVFLFSVLTSLGAPVFLVYGVVRGLGQSLPHAIIPQFIGALIGRYYFRKKLGLKWRQFIPVVAAGFSCGMGLITTVGVGLTFLRKAVVVLPF